MELLQLVDKEDFLGHSLPARSHHSNSLASHIIPSDDSAGRGLAGEDSVDKATVTECDGFLTEVLVVGLGPATEFNPLACPSGRMNATRTVSE